MTFPPHARRVRRTFCRVCEAACGLLAPLDATGRPVALDFNTSQGKTFREIASALLEQIKKIQVEQEIAIE